MKLLKKFKKGFTLVELVVVIAVIAILAAVSVVSYIGVTNNAKKSVDSQVLEQVNNALILRETKDGEKPATMHDALEVLNEDLGVSNVEKLLNATYKKYEFAYDLPANRFVLLEGSKVAVCDDAYDTETTTGNEVNFWKFATSIAEDDVYSHYCAAGFTGETVTTCSGFDSGDNNTLRTLNYTNTSGIKNVIIRTNSAYITLNVDAFVTGEDGDTVSHYDTLGKLNVQKVAMHCYFEYGSTAYAVVSEGKVVAKDGGSIDVLFGKAEDIAAVEDGGTIGQGYTTSKEIHDSNNENGGVNAEDLKYVDENSTNYTEDSINVIGNDAISYDRANESGKSSELAAEFAVYNVTQDVGYEFDDKGLCLQNAFAESKTNDTIVLLNDIAYNYPKKYVNVNKDVKLFLNGKTISKVSSGDPIFFSYANFVINGNNGSIIVDPNNLENTDGLIYAGGDSTLIVNDTKINGYTNSDEATWVKGLITGSAPGNKHTYIELNNVTATCTDPANLIANNKADTRAIVDAGGSSLTVNGGNYYFDPKSNSRNLFYNFEKATFNNVVAQSSALITESNATTTYINNCNFGFTTSNDWKSVSVCCSNGGNVFVNGGTYKNLYAVEVLTSGGTITINGGSFDGKIKAHSSDYTLDSFIYINGGTFINSSLEVGASRAHIIITGGIFDVDPSDFVSYPYGAVKNGSVWEVKIIAKYVVTYQAEVYSTFSSWDEVEEYAETNTVYFNGSFYDKNATNQYVPVTDGTTKCCYGYTAKQAFEYGTGFFGSEANALKCFFKYEVKTLNKYFDDESEANEFAETVNGTVTFIG